MNGPEPPVTGSPGPLAAADDRLVRACLAREAGAWDEFIGRFAGLFAWVADGTAAQRQLALTTADRDDLVAEIVVECLRNDAAVLRGFGGRSSLPTYLTVVARRVVARTLVRMLEAGRPRTAGTRSAADPGGPIADREQVETLLGRLDTAEARLVKLHYLDGLSYGEISAVLGMPLGSIGPALSRARDKMRAAAD